MEFAYLDESGDLGSKGSKHLVLTLMCTRKKKEVSKIIRDAKKRLLDHNKSARWLKKKGEIKFYSFPDNNLLKRTIRKLADVDINVYFMVFEKNGINVGDGIKSNILAHLFRHIMVVSNKKPVEKVIADLNFFNKQKLNRFILREYSIKPVKLINQDGEQVVEEGEITFSGLTDEEYEKAKKDFSNIIIEIEHRNSRLSEELQAVDLISGCIFAHFENKNSEYIDIINSGKIKIQGNMFKKQK
jgi:hypothetical protein